MPATLLDLYQALVLCYCWPQQVACNPTAAAQAWQVNLHATGETMCGGHVDLIPGVVVAS